MSNIGVFDTREAARLMKERNGEKVEKANVALVEEARRASVQPRATETQMIEPGETGRDVAEAVTRGISFFFQSGDVLPPYWSPQRDAALYEFWRNVSVLSGAMYAMVSKMATIPWHIEPRDKALTSHFQQAMRYEKTLREGAEFGSGWGAFIQKQMQSLLGQDNGRFMELIDLSPNKMGPLKPPVLTVAHLDPSRCTRTSSPEYPVRYMGSDGKRRALHWTRVAFDSQLPSERERMYGVGFCAVSRGASYGQNMLDMALYKSEKIGSRPQKGIMIAKGGLDAEEVGVALDVAARMSDDRGLNRYSMMPIIGNSDIEEAAIDLIDLSSLPDGFDEETWTFIAMAAIALAFGVDARELWPQQSRGATRADAVLSHVKQRGKGPGHIITETERMFNNWYLPRHLMMVFDFQDDAQDRQRAEIEQERARARKINLENKVTGVREERMMMVTSGVLTDAQFKDLELDDGRLPDGKPLDTLFFREEPVYKEILTLPGISNPTDIRGNEAEKVLDAISKQKAKALEILAGADGEIKKRQAKEALFTLENLAEEYEKLSMIQKAEEQAEASDTRDDPKDGQREEAQGAPAQGDGERTVTTIPRDGGKLNRPPENEIKSMGFFDRFKKKDDPRQMIFDVFKEAMKPPDVIVEVKPEIIVQPATPPDVTVNVEKQDAPVVHVSAPEVKPEITIQMPEPQSETPQEEKQQEGDAEYEIVDLIRNDRGEVSRLVRKKEKR